MHTNKRKYIQEGILSQLFTMTAGSIQYIFSGRSLHVVAKSNLLGMPSKQADSP